MLNRSKLLFCALLMSSAGTLPAFAEAEQDRITRITAPTSDFSRPEKYEIMQAGAATHRKRINGDAFSHPSANMAFDRRLYFELGDGIFKKMWVSAPASTKSSDGLGPLYNARSCQRCHLKDGRGAAPDGLQAESGSVALLLRLSIPPQNADDHASLKSGTAPSIPDPVYGGQLQNFATPGQSAEATVTVTYEETPVPLPDGTIVSLRKPVITLTGPGYGPFREDLMISPRIASPMIGLGMLEALSEEDILSWADPDDRDGDGISGRGNRIRSKLGQEVMLGRFGWKANQATLKDQVTDAFSGDLGISSSLHPANAGDCTPAQTACIAAPDGGDARSGNVEVNDHLLDLVTFYSRNLAVPARRDVGNPAVLAGKKIFYGTGCIACHRPKYVTPRDPLRPEQSFQLVWPYTDMLLHDMGDGLADDRPDGFADGREWRTPPLWGIGLTKTVSGHTHFLHDGRARNLLEAILWHGGEATTARNRVIALPTRDRENLLRFLNSL
ncbi:di-heme oxidoredictase family protein [uncultured Nisaea sp.]|uniref:di-heme oxidoreductase family protein n=1 Tax=uncultured Nisaea sp. TaxID=538215 RepID=UPI0030EE8AA8|tara:strand:+ start:6621 stop:8120 length:1500 start_codon:yes stop_codon:yes gene_type:complete